MTMTWILTYVGAATVSWGLVRLLERLERLEGSK